MARIRIVETLEELDALETSWDRLAEKTPSSFFSSFDYTRAAWTHFHHPSHRLFVLVLAEASSITAIAPFYVARRRMWGTPYRVVQWIATWEGDRPTLLAEGRRDGLWTEILQFLEGQGGWEALDLAEQPVEGPDGNGWPFLTRKGWFWETQPDAVDYYISLGGSWDDYLKELPSNARKQWRQKTRRLSATLGESSVETVRDPQRMRAAVARYVALERQGWKPQARIGVARNEGTLAFYGALLERLAAKGRARIHFLTGGGRDLAGQIATAQGDVTYHWHTTYAPADAAYSPGILLQAAMLQGLFGTGLRELDLLSLKEDGTPKQKNKTEWATGRRETMRWIGYRLCPRLFFALLPKRLKRRWKTGSPSSA
jgi:CelD/BcsL family acetyltransferase involved in cellulose biosynthesis